eukprot:GHVQ01031311.1.p1 GENE.GHVQ01031311.1~~GHVQ01031311.1.p1  ORF type:complete len:344 (+),score=37.40 GHVQ01031311.1:842-1873(+)
MFTAIARKTREKSSNAVVNFRKLITRTLQDVASEADSNILARLAQLFADANDKEVRDAQAALDDATERRQKSNKRAGKKYQAKRQHAADEFQRLKEELIIIKEKKLAVIVEEVESRLFAASRVLSLSAIDAVIAHKEECFNVAAESIDMIKVMQAEVKVIADSWKQLDDAVIMGVKTALEDALDFTHDVFQKLTDTHSQYLLTARLQNDIARQIGLMAILKYIHERTRLEKDNMSKDSLEWITPSGGWQDPPGDAAPPICSSLLTVYLATLPAVDTQVGEMLLELADTGKVAEVPATRQMFRISRRGAVTVAPARGKLSEGTKTGQVIEVSTTALQKKNKKKK